MDGISGLFRKLVYYLVWPAGVIGVNGSVRTRLLLVSGTKVLVLRDWISNGKWGLTGGGLKKNEDPLQGLIREIKEEIDITLKESEIISLGDKPYDHGVFHFHIHYFYATVAEPKEVNTHHEVKEARWIETDELNADNASEDVLQAIELVRVR